MVDSAGLGRQGLGCIVVKAGLEITRLDYGCDDGINTARLEKEYRGSRVGAVWNYGMVGS